MTSLMKPLPHALIALAMLAVCAFAAPSHALAQGQPQWGVPGMAGGHARGTILGIQGYYEVTPAGAIVLYPSTPVTAPGVMHTILGMFGASSLVGQRGYFKVTPKGELFLYFPPGTTWPGMQSMQIVPDPYGKPGLAPGTMAQPSGQ